MSRNSILLEKITEYKYMKYYSSPRWSNEFTDCSVPVTLDTYNKCSFNCLYCFSFFQKSHNLGDKTKNKQTYYFKDVPLCYVNVEKIKDIFLLKIQSQFSEFIKNRFFLQWGGLADQFDYFEKKYGITLELLKFFSEINYPITFSTKSTWWVYDDRYIELFKKQDNWNIKISIINLDEDKSKRMEIGVPSPYERLKAIKELSKYCKGGVTLRLRPFIIGLSDKNNEYLDLIKQAKDFGATAVSTEFLCIEQRADERLKHRYKLMSQILNFDLLNFYKQKSITNGYLRLNKNIKLPYIIKMYELCKKLNLRFYVSDAHCKEFCNNGSCCGLNENLNYFKNQFTEALVIARKKGQVRFEDIQKEPKIFDKVLFSNPEGLNIVSLARRVKYRNFSLFDLLRFYWNSPNSPKSPYKYFNGALIPIGIDENKDIIYKYNGNFNESD